MFLLFEHYTIKVKEVKKDMWKTILDLIFPISCLGCHRPGKFICQTCLKKIPLNQKLYRNLIVASYYSHPLVKEAIHRYKYDLVKGLAEPLSWLMAESLKNYYLENPLLVPVPLHKKRLKWRGFNQAQLLAEAVSRQLNIPLANQILIREKNIEPQVKIKNSLQREKNVQSAFAVQPTDLSNKTVVLVDDVATTGATLNECRKVLKPLGPKEVWGLVVARG